MYMLLTLQKLYAVCDIALGLLVSKATNITLKDSNVEPVLPSKCFVKQAKVCTSDSPDFFIILVCTSIFIFYFIIFELVLTFRDIWIPKFMFPKNWWKDTRSVFSSKSISNFYSGLLYLIEKYSLQILSGD